MEKIEYMIKVRGGNRIDMSKYDLTNYVAAIVKEFKSAGLINWQGEDIDTNEKFIVYLMKYNDDRHKQGYTTLTEEEINKIKEELYEPKVIIPRNQLEKLDVLIGEVYDKMLEEIAVLKMQLDEIKSVMVYQSGETTKATKKSKANVKKVLEAYKKDSIVRIGGEDIDNIEALTNALSKILPTQEINKLMKEMGVK